MEYLNPNFMLLLVVLTFVSGLIWLFDSLFLKKRRLEKAALEQGKRIREPVAVEYSRSLFPILLIVLPVSLIPMGAVQDSVWLNDPDPPDRRLHTR